MTDISEDESAASFQAHWLRSAYDDAGRSASAAQLREHTTAELRQTQGWHDVDAFRQCLADDDVTVTGIRDDGTDAVLEIRTPAGLRLERALRVDSEGRLASMVTRLAGGASMTMVSAAAWRAAHLDFDEPVILHDTFAAQLAGDASPYQADAVRTGSHGTTGLHYRWNMAIRSKFAEDTLAAQRRAVGVRHYVLLGAGLDTFALRNPFDDITVFEVDTPASQSWKLDRLAHCGIELPTTVRHVTCDFEEQNFVDRLTDVGFDLTRPSVAAWLGVSYYLTEEAIRTTLERVASWPSGSALVFDYLLASHRWDEFEGVDADVMRAAMAGVAAAGEPMISLFDDEELIDLCRSCGFGEVELLGHDEMRARYMPGRSDPTSGPDPTLKLARAVVV